MVVIVIVIVAFTHRIYKAPFQQLGKKKALIEKIIEMIAITIAVVEVVMLMPIIITKIMRSTLAITQDDHHFLDRLLCLAIMVSWQPRATMSTWYGQTIVPGL